MLLFAIDTSGRSGGITVAQAGQLSFRVIESAGIAGGTFSAQLVPTLAALLSKHGYSAKDLDGFAAASGPGSFTGLRVGLSAIKGLAEALRKPIATVSILEAAAANVTWPANTEAHPVCRVALDASRGEVFFAEYECRHPVAPKLLRESLIPLAELAELVQTWGGAAHLVTPDAGVMDGLRKLVNGPAWANAASGDGLGAVSQVSRPTSEDIARIGARKLLAGETVAVETLDAHYMRRSDAEIMFKGAR
jgi:tRNA threonylcarbamoyladenosine biosynthesis protein TsaB